MCGIIGMFSDTDVGKKLFYGLNCLQHRGQESCGIAVLNNDEIVRRHGMGLVIDVFKPNILKEINGNIGIGHVRYSTSGGSYDYNTQPLYGFAKGTKVAIAHNGNLINYHVLRSRLEEDGIIFQTSIDTEVILALIIRYYKGDIVESIKKTMKQIKGAYSLVIIIDNKLVAVRDPNGFRPLVFGKTKSNEIIFASENSAIEILGGTLVRDINPGEIVVVDNCNDDKISSYLFESNAKKSHCIFEHVYFARNDATLDGINSYIFRENAGRILFDESPVKADLVIPVPDSGFPSAIGFSKASNIPLAEGLVKNRYMGRTFIKPTQSEREMAVKLKLNPLSNVISGKSIVLIDDSIVRGTTSKNLIKSLRDAGALEIHMRITSPPVSHSCYFGIDTPSRKNLMASYMSIDEIKDYIGADSLSFLSINGIVEASQVDGNTLCKACFDGNYPIDPIII